ncbi:MAG TPA: M1 family aminopeptidase [Gemmatimonadaceae bacterium]
MGPLLLAVMIAGAPAPRNADSTARFMSPGISHELAEHRAAQIRNVRYDLTLDVTRRDTAVGHVAIDFDRVQPGDVILDFRGLSLASPMANGHAIEGLQNNGAHLRIPAAQLADGANHLEFDFTSGIAPAGASIIRFHDSADDADYLYTLLVPADANLLFPCFDQPDLKARVTFTLTTPRAWRALANGKQLSADTSGAHITYRFARTQPISTYLIAFAAGPWKTFSATHDGRTITMYVRASRAKEVEADTLLALNGRALQWLERYFDTPFPFDKFAFLLAPAFPFGGMEHPGAIFYNEASFIYRERPTLNQRLGREATIFHEVAHQWFGDYVTMKWFDDLWLKEGFATYMAAKMQADMDPRADAWKTFYLRNKPSAYAVDVTDGTTPIWQSLANLDQAKSNYGAIVYNKAPGVLKQLEYLVGPRAFRDGLRGYLRAHPYGNATWRDLLGAVGAAAHMPLDAWGKAYILRPGMPVLEQHVTVRDGRIAALTLVQHPAQALSGRGAWPIKLEVVLGYDGARPVRLPVEMRAETTEVVAARGKPAPAFVFANGDDQAYALVMLDERSADWLESHIATARPDLLRAELWGALWDMVRDARLAPDRYIRLAMRELPHERDEQVASNVLRRTVRATEAYLSTSQRAELVPALERTLWTLESDSARAYGMRKASLDALIDIAQTPATLAHLDALLDSARVAGDALREPTRWAIVTSLIKNGVPSAEGRLAAETRRDSTSEGRRRAFVAGAAFPSAATKARYFTRYFADRDLNEDWVTASLGAFNEPSQHALTINYLTPALDTLSWIQRNRRIFFLGSWLGAFLDGQTTPAALEQVDAFLTGHPSLPLDLREKVLQSADELRRTVRIRAEYAGVGTVGGR